jgi:hypothetical protein
VTGMLRTLGYRIFYLNICQSVKYKVIMMMVIKKQFTKLFAFEVMCSGTSKMS